MYWGGGSCLSRVFMPVCLSCLRILLCLCVCVCVCVLVFLCDKYCVHLVVSFFVVVIITAPGSVVDLDRRQPHLLQ